MTPDDATRPTPDAPTGGGGHGHAEGVHQVGHQGGHPPPLDSRYTAMSGRVFMTGTQALVRLMMDQARSDAAAGLATGGLVSGYRGSPLATFDMEMWRANRHLDTHSIDFLPAVNEDMAATIMAGTQQAEGQPSTNVDGVFGLWYGKGPGVDRSISGSSHVRYDAIEPVRSYTASVNCSSAGPPFSQLYLIPKSLSGPPGLCDAVKRMPP